MYPGGKAMCRRNEHVCIAPDVRLGEKARVGAGSVVMSDGPARAILARTPVKLLRQIPPRRLNELPQSRA